MSQKQAYTDRELTLSVKFLEEKASKESLVWPVEQLAINVMLERFRWPKSAGSKRAHAILLHLEKTGCIECTRSVTNKLTAVVYKTAVPNASSIIPAPIPTPDITKGNGTNKSETEDIFSYKRFTAAKMNFLNSLPKGTARIKNKMDRRGDDNERWLYRSLTKLAKVLMTTRPDIIISGSCSRSGRHNPKKGKINLRDHNGDDARLYLTTLTESGKHVKNFIIYNGKSSRSDVEEFNNNIILHPGQEEAKLKKAIWDSAHFRSARDLISEVLDDLIAEEMLPSDFNKEPVLNNFENNFSS
ncbi:MAG: hypothetical protein AAB784_00825 [Patescibacteria group bacterium]